MDRAADLVSSISKRSTIKDPSTLAFKRTGEAAAQVILRNLGEHIDVADARILDFGCGSGRVLLPLSRLAPSAQFFGTDVDEEAIEYLSLYAPPNVKVEVNKYADRLPFGEIFDAVYAISVWSHFPEDLSDHWLREIWRVLRVGGIALITVGGSTTLQSWRQTHHRWRDVTVEEYERDGFVYREFVNLRSAPDQYPGLTESWGNTLIHPGYIYRRWTEHFDVARIDPAGMNGNQDIVVLVKGSRGAAIEPTDSQIGGT